MKIGNRFDQAKRAGDLNNDAYIENGTDNPDIIEYRTSDKTGLVIILNDLEDVLMLSFKTYML